MERDVSTDKKLILVVDDEIGIVAFMRDLLESMGYRVLTAASGADAVALYMQKRKEIDLVFLDMIMPGMRGGAAFDALRAMNPELKIILSSGLCADGEVRKLLDKGGSWFIQKPFRIASISKMLQEAFKG